MSLNVVYSLLNSGDLFSVFIRDFGTELFFKSHYEFNSIKRICAEIFNKGCLRSYIAFLNTKLINNDLFYTLNNIAHVLISYNVHTLNIFPRGGTKINIIINGMGGYIHKIIDFLTCRSFLLSLSLI